MIMPAQNVCVCLTQEVDGVHWCAQVMLASCILEIRVSIIVHVCARIVRTCACMCVHVYAYVHVCMYVCMYAYTCIDLIICH